MYGIPQKVYYASTELIECEKLYRMGLRSYLERENAFAREFMILGRQLAKGNPEVNALIDAAGISVFGYRFEKGCAIPAYDSPESVRFMHYVDGLMESIGRYAASDNFVITEWDLLVI